MVQSAALTRRLTGALPDKVSGVRRHRMVSNVPRRNRAAARSTRRKGTEHHVAVARERGCIHNGHCAAARGTRAGLTTLSGVQMATGRGARSRAWTEERSDVVPRIRGNVRWPARRMAGGTGVERHAAAAACDGKGIRVKGPCRNSLRGRDCQAGRAGSPSKTNPYAGPGR